MKDWWTVLSPRARWTLAGAAAGVAALLGVALWWVLRIDHAVLFTDLRQQDAAVMSAELDKLKVPYAVTDNGATLLVERSQVHAVRMKLMGRDLPLHGGVGLELFNNTDFGMTEFAQKINYQRALQGELTRTILAFPEIRDARVHLALPDQGLFRQNAVRPKAALTLTLHSGRSLRPEQVSGIQRLVAAAVPGLAAQEVTLVDQHGVALSRSADENDGALSSVRLDWKRETEDYLSRKAGLVLEKAFGPGQAMASVDVTLNLDQVKITTEDVIAAPDPRGAGATGVLVRERESARDMGAGDARAAEQRSTRGSSMQRDVEYQTGRRIEHVVSQPGAIRRLHVVAVVRQALDEEQRMQVQSVVGAAVGALPERGDTVVVQTLSTPAPQVAPAAPAAASVPAAVSPAAAEQPIAVAPWIAAPLAVVLLAAWLLVRRRATAAGKLRRLSAAERHAALQRLHAWMLEAPATSTGTQDPLGGPS